MKNKDYKELLIKTIAEAKGYHYDNGLVDKSTDEVVAVTEHEVAKILLGQMTTESDLKSVETILKVVEKLPKFESLIEQARQPLEEAGYNVPREARLESQQTGTPGWFRRMMDMFS